MRATLVSVDGVRVGVHRLGVSVGPLHRNLERDLALRVLGLEGDHLGVDEVVLLGLVEVLDVVDETALVHVALDHVLLAALVGERDAQTLVEEGHLLEAGAQSLVVELDGLEDLRVRPEGLSRAGLVGLLALGERGIRNTVGEAHAPDVTLAAHLGVDLARQRVDHRDADAVQTAGHRVATAAELAAGVEDRHDDLDGRLLLLLVDVDRDAAAVVDDAHRAVFADEHLDVIGVTGESLIDGVVDDLVHQVVETAGAGGPDVHAGALAHRFQSLEDLDLVCAVAVGGDVTVGDGGVCLQIVGGRRCHLWWGSCQLVTLSFGGDFSTREVRSTTADNSTKSSPPAGRNRRSGEFSRAV